MGRILKYWFFVAFLLQPLGIHAQISKRASYDVVVAGAGTGGFSAAVQAARMGAKVALLEESDWIGGQMAAAGVGSMDEGVGAESTPPSGLYAEFLDRAYAYYKAAGKSISTCYWRKENSHCIAPSIARKILNDMLAETNAAKPGPQQGHVDLFLQDRVVKVISAREVVTGVITSQHQQFASKVLIDATEYGDVLPLTPARYRMGNSIGVPGQPACTQAITWTAEIRKYPEGLPANLLMQDPPPGYDQWEPKFEKEMRADGNPADRHLPVSFKQYVSYRGSPDLSNPDNYTGLDADKITRTSMNWFNDFDVTTDIFDRAKRQKIICAAKLKTLANIYYFQHQMGERDWSVADDEGYDTAYNEENTCPEIPSEYKALEHNFPQHPYIRESIRLVGEYTLTGGDIRRESEWAMSVRGFTDAIAVGDYADDLHSCNSDPEFFESDLEHITDLPPGFRFGPFQVPLRSLIPEKVDGLLAAEKNISQSRLANGATRLQPITMLTGQAAGALAALSVWQGVPLRDVPADAVQLALLQAGDILARQHVNDLQQGSKPWQAVEYGLVHGWIGDGENKEVYPEKKLSRIEGARILAKAFLSDSSGSLSLTKTTGGFDVVPQTLQQIYKDVPLYSTNLNVVAALHDASAIADCSKGKELFCSDDPMSLNDFLQATVVLAGRKEWMQRPSKAELLDGVKGVSASPVTLGDAASVLYNAAQLQVREKLGLHGKSAERPWLTVSSR